mgnify:CR=1 FL=1
MNRFIAILALLFLAGCTTQKEWTTLDPKDRYLIQRDTNTKIWIYNDGGYTTLYCLRDDKPTFAAHINPNDIYSAYFAWTNDATYSADEGPPRGYAQELTGSNYSSRCIVDLPDGSIIISDDNGDGLADTKTEQRGLDIYHGTIDSIITTNSVTKASPPL